MRRNYSFGVNFAFLIMFGTLSATSIFSQSKSNDRSEIVAKTEWNRNRLESASLRFQAPEYSLWGFWNSGGDTNAAIQFSHWIVGPIEVRRKRDGSLGWAVVEPTQKTHFGAVYGISDPVQVWFVETTRTTKIGIQASAWTEWGTFWGNLEHHRSAVGEDRLLGSGGYNWKTKPLSVTFSTFYRNKTVKTAGAISVKRLGSWNFGFHFASLDDYQTDLNHQFSIPLGHNSQFVFSSGWESAPQRPVDRFSVGARWRNQYTSLGYLFDLSPDQKRAHQFNFSANWGQFVLRERETLSFSADGWGSSSLSSVSLSPEKDEENTSFWYLFDWEKSKSSIEATSLFGMTYRSWNRDLRVDLQYSTECRSENFWANPRVSLKSTISF